MIHTLFALIGPEWFYHPLGQCTAVSSNHAVAMHEIVRCKSYNWWSGIASDIGEITLITGFLVGGWRLHKHLECHVETPENCHRWGRPVPGTGHRACRLHHPHADEKGEGNISAETIAERHEDAATAYANGHITIEQLETAVENALWREYQREVKDLGDS